MEQVVNDAKDNDDNEGIEMNQILDTKVQGNHSYRKHDVHAYTDNIDDSDSDDSELPPVNFSSNKVHQLEITHAVNTIPIRI